MKRQILFIMPAEGSKEQASDWGIGDQGGTTWFWPLGSSEAAKGLKLAVESRTGGLRITGRR